MLQFKLIMASAADVWGRESVLSELLQKLKTILDYNSHDYNAMLHCDTYLHNM